MEWLARLVWKSSRSDGSASTPSAGSAANDGDVLGDVRVADLVAIIGGAGASGVLEVERDGTMSRVYFRDGRIVAARAPGAQDLEALARVLAEREGRYRFLRTVPTSVDEFRDRARSEALVILLRDAEFRRREERRWEGSGELADAASAASSPAAAA